MSTIANAKVAHNYNRYNGYFFGCLLRRFGDLFVSLQKLPVTMCGYDRLTHVKFFRKYRKYIKFVSLISFSKEMQ